MKKQNLLILILLVFTLSCKSQDSDRPITLKENNSTSSIGRIVDDFLDEGILVIYQDKKGNHWFGGGKSGVYFHDGIDLRLFSTTDGLCSHAVIGIHEDNHGNLFFDTLDGVCKFNGFEFENIEVSTSKVNESWQLNKDDLWFRMGWEHNGAYRYDGENLIFLEFPKSPGEQEFFNQNPNPPFNPYGTYYHYKDKRGHVWFGTAAMGLCRFDGQDFAWINERHLTETPEGGSFGIRSIIESGEGEFWICNTRFRFLIKDGFKSDGEINMVNYEKNEGIGIEQEDGSYDFPYFMSIVEDASGDLWMVTYDEGVYRLKDDQLISYPLRFGNQDALSFSAYIDQDGILWIGTHNTGILRLTNNKFEKFTP